jgi:putative component of toxin-antitoxin plasmid stabilization module
MYELLHYQTPEGRDLFGLWLDRLNDRQAQARIASRLLRLHNGNFGDCKPVGEGGDKRTQSTDIQRATERWLEWQRRSNE